MASDYEKIRRDNEDEYGKGIKRWGPRVFTHRYDDRSHFVYEILQNAEDALARRARKSGDRSISFELTDKALDVRHFGKPFDEPDVRGICGIAESTKADLTAIGRFGIGFKSVYAFTDRPEVHSGTEDFAIENFVWPVATKPRKRDPEETLISLPLKADDKTARDEIEQSFKQLGPTSLLFLREIEEIRWRAPGASGLYLREAKQLRDGVRQVSLLGQEHGRPDFDQQWLVFSRPAAERSKQAGFVEIAFLVATDKKSKKKSVQRLERSPLVVFFPTVLETHLGFLIQGPYRTTPSRDNVPHNDEWNRKLVAETAGLLRSTLSWLRDHDLLDTAALECLPLDSTKFGPSSMLEPLYAAASDGLKEEALLPCFGGGHTSAKQALLARTQDLRDLLQPAQLGGLFGHVKKPRWLSSDITHERAPRLRRYLIDELEIEEITPDAFVQRLDKPFLEEQSDAWIKTLYEFLDGQPALRHRFDDIPLVRLRDGAHVEAEKGGQPQAFLTGKSRTDFPTVRPAVCSSEASRRFLQSLGLTEPDPVDDVIRNLLPKYSSPKGRTLKIEDYDADIGRILTAFDTNSRTQRDKLVEALRQAPFVLSVDAGTGTRIWAAPSQVYLSTERFRELFSGIGGVLLVDDEAECLRGERVRELLEASGATRTLQPIVFPDTFTWEERREMRRAAGCENSTSSAPIQDHTLRGMPELLTALPKLEGKERIQKARALWEALGDLEDRRGTGAFSGIYKWFYHRWHNASFDAAFVRVLNDTEWVPDVSGQLHRPEYIVFERLGWKVNPFLTSKIKFKPPVIEQLAKEAGLEPGVLDMLKKHGIKNVADLAKVLGVENEEDADEDEGLDDNDKTDDTTADGEPDEHEKQDGSGGAKSGTRKPASTAGGHERQDDDANGQTEGSNGEAENGRADRDGKTNSTREFVSYIAATPDDERDPDHLNQAEREALEEKAIQFILSREAGWQRTQRNNRGFDLYKADGRGNQIEWAEVKAMTGQYTSRPVGMSGPQFDCARLHGEAYWLYVVELAGSEPRLIRIKDPAGKAKTFTFDHGWSAVAEPDQ